MQANGSPHNRRSHQPFAWPAKGVAAWTCRTGRGKNVMAKVLYLITCAAPPARDADRIIRMAQDDQWDVCLLATPSATRFLDLAALEKLTGHPVRSAYKEPGDPDVLPEPDAVIVAPATVNTINKWALGICDTLPLRILVEAIGQKLPIVALPFTNHAHAAHPAFN